MPFYEYECSSCKFYTELMQKISDAPLTKCPSCGKKTMVKLISAPNFRLKGAGWYETDFKGDKENKRNLAGSDAEEPSKTETASSDADSTKTEAPKTETPAKTDTPSVSTSSGTSSKAAGKSSAGGSSGGASVGRSSVSGSKATAGRQASGGSSGRASKPASRVAASKARPVASVRSKAKSAARKKKGRR